MCVDDIIFDDLNTTLGPFGDRRGDGCQRLGNCNYHFLEEDEK